MAYSSAVSALTMEYSYHDAAGEFATRRIIVVTSGSLNDRIERIIDRRLDDHLRSRFRQCFQCLRHSRHNPSGRYDPVRFDGKSMPSPAPVHDRFQIGWLQIGITDHAVVDSVFHGRKNRLIGPVVCICDGERQQPALSLIVHLLKIPLDACRSLPVHARFKRISHTYPPHLHENSSRKKKPDNTTGISACVLSSSSFPVNDLLSDKITF